MPTLTESLRQTMKDSGLTLYRVAKDTGLGYAIVHGFIEGKRDLMLSSADKLAAYFGLVLTDATKRPRSKPATKRKR